MPINNFTVSTPEPRTLSIQIWDKSNMSLIEEVDIQKSELGINPRVDDQDGSIHHADLTEGEKEKNLTKNVKYKWVKKIKSFNKKYKGERQMKI